MSDLAQQVQSLIASEGIDGAAEQLSDAVSDACTAVTDCLANCFEYVEHFTEGLSVVADALRDDLAAEDEDE